MDNLNDFFQDLDKDFIGINKASDDTYSYNATDVLVQTTFELPIVIQWPDSTVKFEFCSNPGDISFGIVFVAAPEEGQDIENLEIETVEEMGRVTSNIEPVSGSFEVPCEGVVFFMWDNNYDWSANKQISYQIEVKQPSFSLSDKTRLDKVQPLLTQVVEDLKISYVQTADAEDAIEHNEANIFFLEDQLQALQNKLTLKKQEQQKVDSEIDLLQNRIHSATSLVPGLCIRQLSKQNLMSVLGFLNLNGSINCVSKYWQSIAAELRIQASNPSFPVSLGLKRCSRSEVKTALAQLKFAAQRLKEQSNNSDSKISTKYDDADATTGSQQQQQYLSNSSTRASTTEADDVVSATVTFIDTTTAAAEIVSSSASLAGHKKKATKRLSDIDLSSSGDDADIIKTSVSKSLVDPRSVEIVDNNTLVKVSNNNNNPSTTSPRISQQQQQQQTQSRSSAINDNNNNTTDNNGSGGGGTALRISYDNMLPTTNNITNSFTTKVSPVTIRTSGAATTTAMLQQQYQHLQMQQQQQKIKNSGNAVGEGGVIVTSSLSSSQPSPLNSKAAAATVDIHLPLVAESKHRSKTMVKQSNSGSNSNNKNNGSPNRLPSQQQQQRQNDDGSHHTQTIDNVVIAEKEEDKVHNNRNSRFRSSSAQRQQQDFANTTAAAAAAATSKKLLAAGEDRHLLLHVKKIRSEQQLNAMLEYLQSGFLKLENLSNEKRRIKKLIRAWNSSFEKNNSRLPTSSERKGHLRELYEEYHQITLALRIRSEKMNETLHNVGLNQKSFEQLLRDKKI